MIFSTSKEKAKVASSATLAMALLFSVGLNNQKSEAAPQSKLIRSGLYQFAYEEKGATIKQPDFIELYADGHWKMYRLPLQSGLRAPQVPRTGTYKIVGQKITFRESKQSWKTHFGPGRPSVIDTARFQGKNLFIVSMEKGIVISQTVSNARYVKIR
jgi:hypothetical protein